MLKRVVYFNLPLYQPGLRSSLSTHFLCILTLPRQPPLSPPPPPLAREWAASPTWAVMMLLRTCWSLLSPLSSLLSLRLGYWFVINISSLARPTTLIINGQQSIRHHTGLEDSPDLVLCVDVRGPPCVCVGIIISDSTWVFLSPDIIPLILSLSAELIPQNEIFPISLPI